MSNQPDLEFLRADKEASELGYIVDMYTLTRNHVYTVEQYATVNLKFRYIDNEGEVEVQKKLKKEINPKTGKRDSFLKLAIPVKNSDAKIEFPLPFSKRYCSLIASETFPVEDLRIICEMSFDGKAHWCGTCIDDIDAALQEEEEEGE